MSHAEQQRLGLCPCLFPYFPAFLIPTPGKMGLNKESRKIRKGSVLLFLSKSQQKNSAFAFGYLHFVPVLRAALSSFHADSSRYKS